MKKAKASTTIKINGIVYVGGTVFFQPYPDGIADEITSGSGLVIEFDATGFIPAPTVVLGSGQKSTVESTVESAAEKKRRLAADALEKFGVKINLRQSVAAVEAEIENYKKAAATSIMESDDPDADLGNPVDSDMDEI